MVPIQHEYADSSARERSSWRARQRTEHVGLSVAERASREALKAENQPKTEPEPRQKPDDEQAVPIRYDYTDSTTRGGSSRRARRPESQRRKPDDEQTVRIRYNDVDAPLNEGPGLARLRKDMKRRATSPHLDSRHQKSDAVLRRGPWSCKNCGAKVRGHLATCPVCKTPGSAETAKFQELGRSILSEKREQFEREEEDDLRGARPSLREEEPEKSSAESQEKEGKDKEAQWSWDMSALEQLETLEAQEEPAAAQKKKKERREGRRQRQAEAEETDIDDEFQRLREERKRQKKEKAEKKKVAEAAPAPLYLPDFISVGNLADVIGVRPAQFVSRMEQMGFEEVTYEHVLDAETAGLVAAEYNYEAIFDQGSGDLKAAPLPEDTSNLLPRPPVVTIMGHVDHGKTTILDWLRKSSVAATEHGGITQHIGAFSVAMPSGKTITFLDTPGHSAFLEMRRRGADVTDIVVLVVAADDSVKPQTVEAIKHATQSNVPIIVAMSKIDKEGCNPDKVKQDLSVHGVHVEDYGGDVQAIAVSGKTGAGMIELEEAIGVLSEMLDHRAERDCNAEGWVLEATTKSYGRVASALIRRGTLRPGDIIVAGTTWARVRTLRNEAGVAVSEATPGMPVEIDGWREQPAAGSEILQADTEQQAKDVVEYRLERSEAAKMGEDMTAINEARAKKRRLEKADSAEAEATVAEKSGPKPVNFIIKADVDGSAEAVVNSIAAIGNNEVYANVLRSGVGPVGEFDIEHAATANGKVISFNMPIDASMLRMAEQEGVQILDHNIIYKLIDDIKAVLSEELPPTVTQRVTGEAEVQQVFEITIKNREKTAIAGCRVRNGMINKARKVRVVRGNETIYDGKSITLSPLASVHVY